VNELDLAEAHALRDAVLLGGGRVATVGGAVCFTHPRTAMTELNRAIPVGRAVDVGAISAWFEGREHTVCVPPGYIGLEEQLAGRGYTQTGAWMKFRRDVELPAPFVTDLRVEETRDRAAFALVSGEGSGMPGDLAFELSAVVGASGWRCFVAWDGDEPAGGGALYVDGEVAWLGIGATRPAYRRRGSQNAILAARIETARQLGVKRLATETGAEAGPSYRNILRSGFAEAYRRPNWLSQPSR
jgi:GNAT superfamily N-acetyltransferase